MIVYSNPPHVFFKYCSECGKKYNPTGKYAKYCEKCLIKRRKDRYSK